MCIFLIMGVISALLEGAYIFLFFIGIVMALVAGYCCGLFVLKKYEIVILCICFLFYGIGVYKYIEVTKIYEKYDRLQYMDEYYEKVKNADGSYVQRKDNSEKYSEEEKFQNEDFTKEYIVCGEIIDIKRNTYGYTITLSKDKWLAYVYTDSSLCGLNTENDKEFVDSKLVVLYGKYAMFSGEIIPMKKARNFGNYDEYQALRSKGALCKISAKEIKLVEKEIIDSVDMCVNICANQRETIELLWKQETDLLLKDILSNNKKTSLKSRIYIIKSYLGNVLKSIATEKEYGILAAMVLGDNTDMDKEVKELYGISGISHILTISGLHISLIGMGLYKFLRKKMRYITSATVSLGVMAFFLIFIGNTISAKRAVVMFFIHIFSDLYGRKYDTLSALSLAGIFILVDNPYYLLNSSFQLSFIAIIAVSLSAPLVTNLFFNELDERIKEEKNGKITLKKCLFLIGAYFGKIFIFNIAITLTLLPINSYLSYRHSTYSPLINMIVVPFVGIVLCMALLGIMFAIFLPFVGAFFIGTSVYLLRFFSWLSELFVKLPYANIVTGKPKLLEIILYYFLCAICLVIIWKFVELRRGIISDIKGEEKFYNSKLVNKNILYKLKLINRQKKSVYVFVIVIISIFLFIIFREKYNGFTISFLDVGQGACIYIKSDDGNNYLIDGGSSDEKNVGEYKIESFLEARQVSSLEYVFVTHCDTDHISGIIEIMERGNILIKNLVLPITEYAEGYGVEEESRIVDKYGENYEVNGYDGRNEEAKNYELIKLAMENGINVVYMKQGDKLKDGKMVFNCINPTGNIYLSEDEEKIEGDVNGESKAVRSTTDINENSLVFLLEYKQLVAVLTGDIGIETEKDIIGNLRAFKFDDKLVVFDVAHHGSGNSNSKEFLDLICPNVSIVSCGADNSYGHPSEDVLKRLNDVGSEIWCTYISGLIEIYEDKGGMKIQGYVRE